MVDIRIRKVNSFAANIWISEFGGSASEVLSTRYGTDQLGV
jgi:hypothetical protein